VQLEESEIFWLEAASQYVRVHTETAHYVDAEPLTRYHAKLGSDAFVRVHRSAVVNADKVQRVLKKMNGLHELQLLNGASVPLSRSRKTMVDDFLAASAQNRGRH
jgi:two-component system LytT family response regulator